MLPNHVAIIPDGNRRWAKANRLLPWQGHEEGTKRFWDVADAALELGVKHLTFWSGSYSNLSKRSSKEVQVLFRLMEKELKDSEIIKRFTKNEVKGQVFGEWENFSPHGGLTELVGTLETKTKAFTKHVFTVLFGYDGQREMIAAINKLRSKSDEVTAESLKDSLWTGGLPDVDLVIRTGGEPHWSAGFMMWHTANSQFVFDETLWPDFTSDRFKAAIEEFSERGRRLGK